MQLNDTVFDKSYDIVIVGLGTAGAIALITAAKKGLKVLGIESLNAMGGTGTLGAIGGYYFGSKGGIYEQINEKVQQLQGTMYTESTFPRFDTKAYLLETTAIKYGAEILYESRVTEVYTQGTAVRGICCFTNGKYTKIGSKIIIDCTGEAEVCHLAGCPTKIGRQYDGQTQPFSNMSIVTRDAKVFSLNKDSGYVEQNHCEDLSHKIISSTAFLMNIKNNSNGETKFLTTASVLGVREGRTIIGEENITLEDFFNNNTTDKPLFYAYSNVDNHGKDTAFEEEILQDWYIAAGLWGINFSIGVPLGALIPKGYQGILVAGRCLAVDHNIAPCIRMKSDMEKCGEAAAEIAYLSITDGVSPRDVDYGKLASILSGTKCLDAANNIGFVNRVSPKELVPFQWLNDTDEIIEGLRGEKPSIAIWSAKRIGSKIVTALKNCLTGSEPLLKKNTAIVLGLQGDLSACNTLRKMVVERDGFIPTTSIKYAYTHATSAIYLLGKLKDQNSVETLLEVIQTEGEFDSKDFKPDELYATEADVRFQYISYALVALSKIAEEHPELKTYIKERVTQKLTDKGFSICISLKGNPYIKYDMADKLRLFAALAF